MGSPENPNWFLDSALIDELADAGGDFAAAAAAGGYCWTSQGVNSSSGVSVDIDGSFTTSDDPKASCSSKRNLNYSTRTESGSGPASKACREKMRRDKLNDRFIELGSVIDPGKPPKSDKAAILSDAACMVTQLRIEAQKLKDSNESLQEKIKELKAEKNELRDEKQKLKAEKESLEQQIKLLNSQPTYIQPPLLPTVFAAQGQAAGHKLMMPVLGYPGFPMWQFMPPGEVDTSKDTDAFSPVA
ncbi:transcription factor ILR3-like isoform X1 [Typha angustifolia]|uniref:transcription factor ILR3-like isoform X1 n=1 Tax=Typha angustifolia TaxID=59011 RepID=UPI003C306D53